MRSFLLDYASSYLNSITGKMHLNSTKLTVEKFRVRSYVSKHGRGKQNKTIKASATHEWIRKVKEQEKTKSTQYYKDRYKTTFTQTYMHNFLHLLTLSTFTQSSTQLLIRVRRISCNFPIQKNKGTHSNFTIQKAKKLEPLPFPWSNYQELIHQ